MATVRGVDSVSNSPCVANSNFTSSTGSLVVCALSRCSLDARFWNGTTALHSLKDRTVDWLELEVLFLASWTQVCLQQVLNMFSLAPTSFAFVVAAPGRMAGTTLRTYVGLSAAAADRLFQQRLPVQPKYKQRWGLKPTVEEAV